MSCVAKDSLYEEGFQVYLDRGCPRLQLAFSSPTPRAKLLEPKGVSDQLNIRIFHGVKALSTLLRFRQHATILLELLRNRDFTHAFSLFNTYIVHPLNRVLTEENKRGHLYHSSPSPKKFEQ